MLPLPEGEGWGEGLGEGVTKGNRSGRGRAGGAVAHNDGVAGVLFQPQRGVAFVIQAGMGTVHKLALKLLVQFVTDGVGGAVRYFEFLLTIARYGKTAHIAQLHRIAVLQVVDQPLRKLVGKIAGIAPVKAG